MSELSDSIKAFSESNIVNMRVKYGEKNEEKSLDEMITTCDICGKTIIGIKNFINAGDKVVCSEECLHKAIGEFRHWENTLSHNWTKP
jgi:hypothetical protein